MLNRQFLAIFLLISCGISWADKDIRPFTSDGCSLFPDGDFKNKQRWLHCCIDHDIQYWQGGTWQQRLQSDRELRNCVIAAGEPIIADIMLNGVRMGGSPYWPTSYRWGYGWDYWRGYKPLSRAEKQSIQRALKAYTARTAKQGTSSP